MMKMAKCLSAMKKGEAATEAEIKKFCRECRGDYKAPGEVVIMDALPKLATGKVRQQSLRE